MHVFPRFDLQLRLLPSLLITNSKHTWFLRIMDIIWVSGYTGISVMVIQGHHWSIYPTNVFLKRMLYCHVLGSSLIV